MTMRSAVLMCGVLAMSGCAKHGLVDVSNRVRLDMRYAATNNFTGQRLYWENRCFLREQTAQKLRKADEELERLGFRIKVLDCYRPLDVQRKMWSILPDDRYVADPAKGSKHNRGAAVDVTLVHVATGVEVWMPTPYDDFSERAHRNYMALPPQPLTNRNTLEQAMKRNGFVGLETEWWHFDDVDWQKYPVLNVRFEEIKSGRTFGADF